jgi:hypothetical protein
MLRLIALAILSLAFSVVVGAQTTRATAQVKSDDGRVVYATYAPGASVSFIGSHASH